MDESRRVRALFDFGLMTMVGDPLFDIATGWGFLDMYNIYQANLRERYLSVILDRLGSHIQEKLMLHVLFYSVISADFYSPICADGHYQWCVDNLNHQTVWKYFGI